MNTKKIIKIVIFTVVMLIPIIYSFFYLKSYWDPYGNLKDMKVAMVNLDKGDNGENEGQRVIDSLKEKRLITIKNSYALKSPYQLIDKKANKYLQIVSKLETLSPLLTIKRGYSITRIDGKVLSSVKKIKKKDVITVEFSDGDIKAEVL